MDTDTDIRRIVKTTAQSVRMANDNSTTEEDGDQYNENPNDHRDRRDNLSTQRCRKV